MIRDRLYQPVRSAVSVVSHNARFGLGPPRPGTEGPQGDRAFARGQRTAERNGPEPNAQRMIAQPTAVAGRSSRRKGLRSGLVAGVCHSLHHRHRAQPDHPRRARSHHLEPLRHRPRVPFTRRLDAVEYPRQFNTRPHQPGDPRPVRGARSRATVPAPRRYRDRSR